MADTTAREKLTSRIQGEVTRLEARLAELNPSGDKLPCGHTERQHVEMELSGQRALLKSIPGMPDELVDFLESALSDGRPLNIYQLTVVVSINTALKATADHVAADHAAKPTAHDASGEAAGPEVPNWVNPDDKPEP